jgi:imidazolonepropionase
MDSSINEPYGAVDNTQLGIKDGKIAFLGSNAGFDVSGHADEIIDGQNGWLSPGLVDCHTHLIYGGNRATEWEARLNGVSYEDIARKGGGILSTVAATRDASFDQLLSSAQKRIECLMAEGVTTIEIKSGYGLDLVTERKMLEVALALEGRNGITVSKTFLGAHALPPEFSGRSNDYIQLVTDELLPTLASEGLVDAVDVFCEGIGFSRDQCRLVFECAKDLGIPVKGHVEQLSDLSGARLVAEYDGLSVDHLEYLNHEDIPILNARGVVAVLLPGAYYFLGETQQPPIEALRSSHVPLALGSDLNPGSSPICSLLLTMNLACVQFSLRPEEALAATTRNAAKALGLEESKGMIRPGMDADMVLWPIDHPSELSYGVNMVKPSRIWVGGKNAQTS